MTDAPKIPANFAEFEDRARKLGYKPYSIKPVICRECGALLAYKDHILQNLHKITCGSENLFQCSCCGMDVSPLELLCCSHGCKGTCPYCHQTHNDFGGPFVCYECPLFTNSPKLAKIAREYYEKYSQQPSVSIEPSVPSVSASSSSTSSSSSNSSNQSQLADELSNLIKQLQTGNNKLFAKIRAIRTDSLKNPQFKSKVYELNSTICGALFDLEQLLN